MNINQKIQEFLTEHQYQKKRRIFTAVLSLMIVFSVVSSLIMPAISMTMQDLDDAAAVDTIDAEPAEENIMLLGLGDENRQTEPINLAERATSSGGSFNISAIDIGEDGKGKNEIDNNYVVSTDRTNIKFEVSYTLSNMKYVFKKDADFEHLYIDIENFTISNTYNGELNDAAYSEYMANNGHGLVNPGTYEVVGNRIKLHLTDAYIDYIDGGEGNVTGTLNFSGELSRNNTASGDQTIKIGGKDIVIPFQDKQAGVEKNYWVDSSKGEIEWTITVKPNGLSLKDYTLVDNMLQKASGDVSINPSSAAIYDFNSKKVTFNESNTGDVTIKYRTKIGTEDLQAGNVTNKATLQKDGENPIEDSKTVTFDKTPVNVTKDGKADYENGKSRNKKIDWTITITSNYGTSLNGYQIKDANLPDNDVTISPSGTLTKNGDGTWTLNVADNVTGVTLNYSADATDGNNKNSVSIHYPDGSPTGGNTEKTVYYKKESEMISVNKNGNYNQDTHEITWTIQVTPVNGYSLKDYYLEDSQFPTSAGDFQLTDCNTSDFKIENGRLTFTSDIKHSVTLQYKTKVSVPNNDTNAEVTTVVTNKIEDKFTTTKVVSVSVKSRNTITKTAGSQNMSLSQSNAISQELSWKVDITRDGSFDNYIYQDTLTAPENGTHTITADQLAALKVLAKTQEYGNATELKQGTDYTVDRKADGSGFEVKFLSTTTDYNYISFEYSTTATIPESAAYGQYTFNNKGSSNKGGGEPNPGVTIKKKNPVQTISIHVRKDWEDNNNSANDRPTSITFKVQYQENNGEWKALKKSGDTYLFEGDADYSSASVVEVTLNAGNKASWTDYRWETTLSGLPSSVTVNGNTKTYQYRVQEIKYNGNQAIENGVFSTENGVYRNTGGGYSAAVGTNNGEALVINKYYPNVSLQPVKYWKDGNNQDITNYNGDITEITVQLVSKNSDGKFYPVKDSSGNSLTATLDASNGWGKNLPAWNGLSSEKNYLLIETAVKLKDETTKNLFSVSDSGTDYNSKEMSFAVDGTYYKATLLGNSVQPTADATISVTNTVYETKNITVNVEKKWNPTTVPNGVSGIVVELQRKASNSNDWTAYPENDTTKSQQTLNDSNSWHASWSNLPNQNVDNTGRISYTYRVVEVGYVKADGTTVVSIQNDKFALANAQGNADGLYEASYVNQELTKDGTVQITNTYKQLTSIELTPEKKWEGDIDSQTQNPFVERPKSITLQLQQRLGENGTWVSMEGKALTLTKNDQSQYDKSTWKSDSKKFENLPEKVIRVNADGSYTEQKYYYQLVEIGYTPNGSDTAISIPAGETSFEVTAQNNGQTYNGRYSFSSDVNNGYSGSLKIKNTYKEDIGLSKNIVIGRTSSNSISISKDELTQFKKKIGTEDYYIFNYTVDFSSSQKDAASPFSDIIPEGFEFCENSNWDGVQMAWQSGSTIDQYSPLTGNPGNIAKHFDGYYEHPVFVWPTYGINSAKVASDLSTIWEKFGKQEWYYYDRANNRVYFNKPDLWAKMYICYSIKIKCADLEAKIANGNYEILNQVIKHEKDGAETAQKDSASVIIKNQTPTDLITKTYQAAALPGYISYTLDINPQGKTLSSGDTIDIEDLFKTVSYYDSDWNGGETTNGTNLVDVLMRNINIYKIDANGDKQKLSASEYTLQFDCSENGVQSDGEKGAALLKLTVPDATHLQVTYSYKIIANKNTPSVIHGCKVRKNGRYVPMESGLVPPAGDKITFSNTAKLKADSASGESSHNNQEYTVFQSGGTISTNPIPKIYKINTGDYTIKSLNASFLLAKYESGNWYYASNVNADGAITWGNHSFSGKTVPATDAYVIKVEGTQPKISLEQNVLYKLVEISVPSGYEGSNLNLSSTDFRALVTGYLNSNLTTYNNKDYATFLNHYNPNHYFSFNSNVSGNNIPHDVSQSEIQQIKSGDDLNIPNSELIDIGVQKQWVNSTNTIPENASITVELYWSYEKSTSGIPASATSAKAEDLGILDSSFNATKTLTGETNANVWTDLPNGKAGKPIYYYVKETAYTYGGNTYTLQEDGSYKDGSDLGGYLPIYQNNAANGDATVQIQNTQRLMLKKVWKDINNEDMNPLSSSVNVTVYGVKVDSAGNETKEALFETPVTLDNTNSWQQDITDRVIGKDLSVYKRFEVTETGVEDTSNMVISCVFNLNQNTGEIIVTNKSTQPTDASVTVQKAWSDGENLHDADTVSVDLYQSTTALPSGTTFSLDWLNKNATKLADKTVTLNKDNDWSYTWAELPLKNDSDQPYYYYVWEDTANSTIANKDKYTVSYTKSSNSTAYKTNYTITNSRSAITVQKQWYDEDGNLITNLYDEDGNLVVNNMANLQEITLKVYKKTGTVPTDQIGVVAFGDSITDGYEGQYSKTEKCYPSKLTNLLTTAGFQLKNSKVDNQGVSQQQIGANKERDTFSSRVGNIPTDTKVVCLLGGTNDIHQSGSSVRGNPQGVFDRLQALIGDIQKQAPNATIFVGSIPHFDFYKDGTLTTGGGWWNWLSGYADKDGAIPNGLIDQYNAKIKTYAEETDGVYFVDVCSVVTDDDIRADGCHPNETGYTKIATAYSDAIQDYYTNKEYLKDSNNQDLEIKLNNGNNWTAAIDVPAGNDTYCVEEVNVPDGWDVTYENNAQQANSTTPILVKNQKQPTDINLTVEKTWAKDDASNRPDSISLTLLRSNRKKQDNSNATNTSEWFWEELRIPTPTPTKNGNKWTFAYTGLPASDAFGNAYYYKVQEAAVNGYTVSYGFNGVGEENGVTATAGETATLHVTNTRAITLQIEKQWSDGATNQHLLDAVRVRIYRSTNPSDVPTANLTLQVTPETVSVGVNGTATVTANKKITVKEIANDTIANATISEDGKTLTITGEGAGETTITVTDGTMEKQISVTVSAEPTLILAIEPTSIHVGETATLTPSMSDGSDCSGVTYSIKAGTDVVSISGNTVTGSKAGTATIVAERNGKTSNEVTIIVTEPPLNLNPESVTVSVGDTATIQANRTVTLSKNPDANIATASVSGKNITVTGVAAGLTSFKVEDSDGHEKTVSVTVNQKTENELPNNRGDSNNFKSQITGLEVGDVISVTMYGTAGTSAKGCFGFNDTSGQWQAYQWGAKNVGSDGKLTVSYTIPNNYANGNYFEFQIWQWNELSSKITKITYTVQKSAPAITLTASSTTLKAKETLQLTSNVTGATYSSSNPQVATVDATTGVVTGVAAGSVRITATKDGCTAGTIDLTVEADVKKFSLTDVSAGKTITVIVTGTAGTKINGCFGYNDTGSGATNGWYQEQFDDKTIGSDGKLTLTHKVRDTYNGNGNAVFQVWHNNSAVSDITYTISDSSSGGGSSGVTEKTFATNSKGEVKSIDFDSDKKVKSIKVWLNPDNYAQYPYIQIRTNAESEYIKFGYHGVDTLDIEENKNNRAKSTIVDKEYCLIEFNPSVLLSNLDICQAGDTATSGKITITYDTPSPQSLSAPRRAAAAAAVIESEQLLSAANETAGVQTQALENTIDASEVSDSDWASGLLLEIEATDHWQGSVTNLPVTDSNGNTYYYWAVEEPVTGYTPSYLFQDADGSQSNAIKADAQVDGTDIIILNTKQDTSYTLPSTGGTGVTRYYLIGLLLMGGGGLVVCYQFRRKRHGNCAKQTKLEFFC